MPIRSSYELTRLFLSLSDVSRLDILSQLYERTSVVDISRRFGLLVNEVARHLHRLEDVGLVRQLPNGDYVISEYGKVVAAFVEGISEVHDLLEYWERHSVAELPPYLRRLPADLSEFFVSDSELLIAAASDLLLEAKKFLFVLNYAVDQATVRTRALKILSQRTSAAQHSASRYADNVYTVLVVNELGALICFPRVVSGRSEIDTSSGFLVTASDVAHRRLVELFDFFWEAGPEA